MSAAIPIKRPPSAGSSSARLAAPSPSAGAPPASSSRESDRKLCRNVLIYGACRFKDKGCIYSHETPGTLPAPDASSSTLAKAASAAVFVPSFPSAPAVAPATSPSGSSMSTRAREFVPRTAATPMQSPPNDAPFGEDDDEQPLEDRYLPTQPPSGQAYDLVHDDGQYGMADLSVADDYGNGHSEHGPGSYEHAVMQPEAYYMANPGVGLPGQDDFHQLQHHQLQREQHQPLMYHLYHPVPPPPPGHPPSASTFFLSPALHVALSQKSAALYSDVPPPAMAHEKPPDEVGGKYYGLVGVDESRVSDRGWKESGWKAWDSQTGELCFLRRIEGVRLQQEQALAVVDRWSKLRHASVIGVREAFTTRAWGDYSIVFVYDFHPLITTLWDAHLSPLLSARGPPNPWALRAPPGSYYPSAPSLAGYVPPQLHSRRGQHPGPEPSPFGGNAALDERTLWTYIVQLVAGLREIHSSGLTLRGLLDGRQVVLTGEKRVRIAYGGVGEVLLGIATGAATPLQEGQQEDLVSLGKLILSLACGSLAAVHNLPKSMEYISRQFPSGEVKGLVLWLFSNPGQQNLAGAVDSGPKKSVEELCRLVSHKTWDELNPAYAAIDGLEAQLLKELENGRLVRLLCKLGFVNERPEFDHDPRWAETGDRYIVKLFRDFVFHQVDERGRPVCDLSHVLTCLNKLDAGAEEKLMLVSRDEQSCLIMSYREVKNCIEGAAGDLARG